MTTTFEGFNQERTNVGFPLSQKLTTGTEFIKMAVNI